MATTLHPLKDIFPIPRRTKKSLKRQMSRWRRRTAKKHPEELRRTPRHVGWYW